MDITTTTNLIQIPKITNGAKIIIGDTINKVTIVVDHHFNWFQKKMIKWCFGFDVENYTEQTEEELTTNGTEK